MHIQHIVRVLAVFTVALPSAMGQRLTDELPGVFVDLTSVSTAIDLTPQFLDPVSGFVEIELATTGPIGNALFDPIPPVFSTSNWFRVGVNGGMMLSKGAPGVCFDTIGNANASIPSTDVFRATCVGLICGPLPGGLLPLPAHTPTLLPYWEDLFLSPSMSKVHYYENPGVELIVQWTDMRLRHCAPAQFVTFQVQVPLSDQEVMAKFIYSGYMRCNRAFSDLPTIGFQGLGCNLSLPQHREWVSPLNLSADRPFPTDGSTISLVGNIGEVYCDDFSGGGRMAAFGSASISWASNLTLTAYSLPPNTFGLFVCSSESNSTGTTVPGVSGLLCLTPPLYRLQPVYSTGLEGLIRHTPDLLQFPNGPPGGLLRAIDPGETIHFQAWYRVSAGSCFTDAISVTFGF